MLRNENREKVAIAISWLAQLSWSESAAKSTNCFGQATIS
jgi:hypothetical protein